MPIGWTVRSPQLRPRPLRHPVQPCPHWFQSHQSPCPSGEPEVRPQLGSEEWNYLGELAEAREELERMIGEYGEPGSSGKTSPFGRSSFVVLKGVLEALIVKRR